LPPSSFFLFSVGPSLPLFFSFRSAPTSFALLPSQLLSSGPMRPPPLPPWTLCPFSCEWWLAFFVSLFPVPLRPSFPPRAQSLVSFLLFFRAPHPGVFLSLITWMGHFRPRDPPKPTVEKRPTSLTGGYGQSGPSLGISGIRSSPSNRSQGSLYFPTPHR